ncbi:uncharacterized protein SAPINGB_P003689 [Magnusiomyces paraingens]|uniref:N-acetylglucosamine-induced protein 1 n=1 Tax=Magnusiomyces paraingens TaxID=2606893 RepID=A0A5E8BW13_9ASCO|nr:uncharacterized protein SAPINGB_P003689 [Saprochaete ingens]VVT53667.1 unnamed protein product [Saprochaete ingens]
MTLESPVIQTLPDDGHDVYYFDDTVPENLAQPMGLVNPKNPLAGLEHIDVLDRDVVILSQTTTPKIFTWEETRDVVERMDLSKFTRLPHDLRNYLRWKYFTDKEYSRIDEKTGERISGILIYILRVRLEGRWGFQFPVYPTNEGRSLFENVASDACILANDFPYALDPKIVHVVVWLRTPISTEPLEYVPDVVTYDIPTTRLTEKSQKLIERFVNVNFVEGLDLTPDRVTWFKNWTGLQSIPALEHFHVMIYDPPLEQLKELYSTGGKQIDIYNL